jgi:hypothetical protein
VETSSFGTSHIAAGEIRAQSKYLSPGPTQNFLDVFVGARMCVYAILRSARRIITASCIMRASRPYIIRRWTSSIAPCELLLRSLSLSPRSVSFYIIPWGWQPGGPCYVPPPPFALARCNMKLPPLLHPYAHVRVYAPSHPLLCLIFFHSPNSRGARRAHKFLAGAKLNLAGIRCTRVRTCCRPEFSLDAVHDFGNFAQRNTSQSTP